MVPDKPESRDQLVNVLVARRMHAIVQSWEERGVLKHGQATKMVRELATLTPLALTPSATQPATTDPSQARW